MTRARFVKKTSAGVRTSSRARSASLYRGMEVVRKPVPELNPSSKSSPAYDNFQMFFYYITCTAYNAYSVHLSGLKLRTVEHVSIAVLSN